MPPAVGDVYQFTVQGLYNGQTVENVFHMREKTGSSTPAQLRTSMESLLAIMAQATVSSLTYGTQVIKQMTPVPFDEDQFPSSLTTHGALSTDGVNNTLAIVITKRTGVAGKSHRGRLYVGGFAGMHTGINQLNPSGIAAWKNTCDALIAAFGPSGSDAYVQLGVYSRAIGGSHPFTVAGWQPVTRLDVQPLLGNQRRRRLGVGI